MPLRPVQHALITDEGFPVRFDQFDSGQGARISRAGQCVDDRRSVRDDDELSITCHRSDQMPERREQLRVQTGLRFIEDQQLRRTRGEHRSDQQQIPQRTVGQFRRSERAQQAFLLPAQLEQAAAT